MVSKLQGFRIPGLQGSRLFQGSKVAMSQGKNSKLPKDAGFQGSRINARF
jgi:hypothetical protein